MLTLKFCETDDATGIINANYVVTQAGAKGSAAISIPLTLKIHSEGAEASVDVASTASANEEEAFDKLAEILELTAKALRARGEPKLGVPVYG